MRLIPSPAFMRLNPLVPAAALFLTGAACGSLLSEWEIVLVWIAAGAWALWAILELVPSVSVFSQLPLVVVLFASGATVWNLNQSQVEANHVVRFAPSEGESLVAMRAQVTVPPENEITYGNQHFVAQVLSVWDGTAWIPATGEVAVSWASPTPTATRPGTALELYGWLSRPEIAHNPEAFNAREHLAADRVFVHVRVPHPGGVTVVDDALATGDGPLASFRRFVRAKFLSHLIREQAPAALTLQALLLGDRDPNIQDISRDFTDAGIAHLLAISGSHLVFVTLLVWYVLRYLPLRPRWRELIIAVILSLYVLATPCGPPVLRAAVALLMVLIARLLGRPRQYLNMLCAAAIVVVVLRPADLHDAGFQLSFVTAAGLILFAERVHAALFANWLARETLVAELSRSRWDRWRLWVFRLLAGAVVANGIGALCAPLTVYAFGQWNPWAPITGFLALPAVSVAMAGAALQLLAEFAGVGARLAPVTTWLGQVLIILVRQLAHIPGAVMALRAPPAILVLLAYGALLLWATRRHLGLSRANIVNAALATAVVAAGWYVWSAPLGKTSITVLDAGGGSALLVQTPSDRMWAIDAGSGPRAGTSVLRSAIEPAMRLVGTRRLIGFIATQLDVRHAREAGDLVERFLPQATFAAAPAWATHGQTLAGDQLARAIRSSDHLKTLTRGDMLDLGDGCHLTVLWPPAASSSRDKSLILALEYRNTRTLIADPAALEALPFATADFSFRAAILTGTPREGISSLPALASVSPDHIIWTATSAWNKSGLRAGERNTEHGAVLMAIDANGLHIGPAAPP